MRRSNHFTALGAALWLALTVHMAGADRPNVLLILADDMGFSDLGCYGGEIPTTSLDSLAQGGLRFTQFYNTARSSPTRAALLTGLLQHQAGMGILGEDPNQAAPADADAGYTRFLNRNRVTIAEALKSAGYHTYMAGKWHLGYHGEEKWELYDLAADRTELHDLAAEKPELVAELAAAWERWAVTHRVLPRFLGTPER